MRDDHKSARHNAKCLKEGWGKQIYSLFTASRAMRNESDEPIQLYRPANLCKEVEDLLLREDDFTDEQIRDFISGKPLPPKVKETSNVDRWREKFHKRRAEIQELSKQLKTGKARIDEYGRLVPVTQPPQPPRANLPPGPQVAAVQQPPPLNFLGDEDEEEQWIERERREAAETIARAVRQYRQEGIPEDEFEVVLIEPGGINPTNLTFRRICIAIFAVVLAFGCIILQTLVRSLIFIPERNYLNHRLRYLIQVGHFSLSRRCWDPRKCSIPILTSFCTTFCMYVS